MLRHFVKPLTHAASRRCHARRLSALREKSQVQQVGKVDEGKQEDVRELLVNLMNTAPSKRELQHFLKRYVPQPELTASHLLSGSGNAARIPSNILSPQKYVDALLAPSAHQLAVTKVEGPFEKQGWDSVGSTLVKLQKLGLTSIVVSDNAQWFVETETPADLSKTMVRETMALVESIEKAGGRARLIHGGVLEQGTHGIEAQLDFIQSSLDNRQSGSHTRR